MPRLLLLLLLAAPLAAPAAWPALHRPPAMRDRFLQQGPATSAAAPSSEAQPQPTYAVRSAATMGTAPAAEPSQASPYRFADVGSTTAASVEAAIGAGGAAGLAAAAAAAGPEAAGRAVTEAVLRGQGPALAALVDATGNAAAADAFLTASRRGRKAGAAGWLSGDGERSPGLASPLRTLTPLCSPMPRPLKSQGLWPAICLNPSAAAQTLVSAVAAGGAAAAAAAQAATLGSRQCCGSTLVALSREVPAAWHAAAAAAEILPACACPRPHTPLSTSA